MISFKCPFRIYSGSDLPNHDCPALVKVCHGRSTDRLDSSQRQPGLLQLPAATTREDKTQFHLPLKQGTDPTLPALQPGAIKSFPVISCSCWAWTSDQAQGGDGDSRYHSWTLFWNSCFKTSTAFTHKLWRTDKLHTPVIMGPWQSIHRCWIGEQTVGTGSPVCKPNPWTGRDVPLVYRICEDPEISGS